MWIKIIVRGGGNHEHEALVDPAVNCLYSTPPPELELNDLSCFHQLFNLSDLIVDRALYGELPSINSRAVPFIAYGNMITYY